MQKVKKAEMSLLGALVAFSIIILMCPVFEFFQISRRVNTMESNIQAMLGDVCSVNSIIRYDNVKYMANDVTNHPDLSAYIQLIFSKLGYEKRSDLWIKNDIEIKNANLSFDTETYYFKLTYEMNVPIKILNKTIATTEVQKVASSALISMGERTEKPPLPVNPIPEGATYTIAATGEVLTAGMEFPDNAEIGDIYTYDGYEYRFNHVYTGSTWTPSADENGWSVRALNKTNTSYQEIIKNILDFPVVNMDYAFSGCTQMTAVPEIPDTVRSLNYTFQDCKKIVQIPDIPESVGSLVGTFYNCQALIYIPEIPDSVTDLSYTYYGCSALVSAPEIPIHATSLQSTFEGCKKLSSAPEIPDGVTTMQAAFKDCEELLAPPSIPDTVKNVRQTFYNCKKMTSIGEYPSGVTGLPYTYYGCLNVKSVPAVPDYITNLDYTFARSGITTTPKLPDTITELFGTFAGSRISTVSSLPSGLQNLYWTFDSCSALKTPPVLPLSVKRIDGTFANSGITSLPELHYGVISISSAFENCNSLKEVDYVIPASVTELSLAFADCYYLSGTMRVNSSYGSASGFLEHACGSDYLYLYVSNAQLKQEIQDTIGLTMGGTGHIIFN